eukprot:Polyplicarium_translucidae@DN5109_c0_g1_i1.p1
MQALVGEANRLRTSTSALTSNDGADVTHRDSHNMVLGFAKQNLFAVVNLGGGQWTDGDARYRVKTPFASSSMSQIFNTQAAEFGGWDESWTCRDSDRITTDDDGGLSVKLPKISLLVFKRG